MKRHPWQVKLLTILFSSVLVLTPALSSPANAQEEAAPETATIAGTLQSELGCSGDWMPGCELTYLTYDANSDVWMGTFNVTPGNDAGQKRSALQGGIERHLGY